MNTEIVQVLSHQIHRREDFINRYLSVSKEVPYKQGKAKPK